MASEFYGVLAWPGTQKIVRSSALKSADPLQVKRSSTTLTRDPEVGRVTNHRHFLETVEEATQHFRVSLQWELARDAPGHELVSVLLFSFTVVSASLNAVNAADSLCGSLSSLPALISQCILSSASHHDARALFSRDASEIMNESPLPSQVDARAVLCVSLLPSALESLSGSTGETIIDDDATLDDAASILQTGSLVGSAILTRAA